MRLTLSFVLFFVFFTDCTTHDLENKCLVRNLQDMTNYSVTLTSTTPDGVKVDTSKNNIDLDLIDCVINEVESCLQRKFPTGKISDSVAKESRCLSTIELPFDRECITIKIPDDWHVGCSGEQLLSIPAPLEGCTIKNENYPIECGCYWRGAVQDNRTIVVTPNLKLLPDWLIRTSTGCLNPWGSTELSECAQPVTRCSQQVVKP
jgi:hypothetical protein